MSNTTTPLLTAASQLVRVASKTYKSKNELGISKVALDRWITSDEFYHVKVPVDKLPLLYGDLLASAEVDAVAVIVDVNKNRVNKAAHGYVPKVAIVAGAELVRKAKEKDIVSIDCWLGKKAARLMKIHVSKPIDVTAFAMCPESAPGIAQGSISAPSATHGDGINFGPPGNALHHPEWQFMSMQNVQEALSMYISSLKDGSWKPISSQWALVPPSLVNATNEAGIIARERGMQAFAPLDFVFWQKSRLSASVKSKRVNGKELTASKFKKVVDEDDPSTWTDLK